MVDLRSRSGYKPDVAAVARNEISTARAQLELGREEFADLLSPILGWAPSPEAVESWETSTVPPGDVLVAAGLATHGTSQAGDRGRHDIVSRLMGDRFSDVAAIFSTRSEFTASFSPYKLFDDARNIRVAGLSLNVLAQSYPDQRLREVIEEGAHVQCLFLDPDGAAMKAREEEEGHAPGMLSALTALNIQMITSRVREALSDDARDRLEVRTYDETPRFNITIADERCIVQPYLPEGRGIDSPTFVIERQWPSSGLFPVFDQVFYALWERSQPL